MTTPATTPDTTIAEPANFGKMLKDGTWDLHQQAEHAALPAMLLGGEVSREVYVALLSQQHAAQRPLDDAILRQRDAVPALARLIDDEQLQCPHLEADLRHFGVDPASIEPGPGAKALAERAEKAEREAPVTLLGLHYVREGANNGNAFLARKVRGALGVPQDQIDGFRHLDPYGPRQREKWATFKQGLDTLDITDTEKQACVDAARDMFNITMLIHRDCEPAATNR